jgi:hypothetical protein
VVKGYAPEGKIGMSHEIGDTLEHTPWFEHERWESDPREVHANPKCPLNCELRSSKEVARSSPQLGDHRRDDGTFVLIASEQIQ